MVGAVYTTSPSSGVDTVQGPSPVAAGDGLFLLEMVRTQKACILFLCVTKNKNRVISVLMCC